MSSVLAWESAKNWLVASPVDVSAVSGTLQVSLNVLV